MSKRTKTAQFRVTEEEDAHLRKAAEDAGMKLSDYLRGLTLHPTVAVVDGLEVVLIPSTVTLAAADEQLRDRFRAILASLQGQGESPAPAPPAGDPAPAGDAPVDALAAMAPPAASAAPGSPPATPTSPGGEGGMVGSSLSSPAALASPSQDPAGAAPGEGTSAPPQAGAQLPPPVDGAEEASAAAAAAGSIPGAGREACPHCGGTEGRHQGFCETVTGEPPVLVEDPGERGPMPSQEQEYIARRVQEGELAVVAEAEWRQRQGAEPVHPEAPALVPDRREPCPSCGAVKLPEAQCADCGRRPG